MKLSLPNRSSLSLGVCNYLVLMLLSVRTIAARRRKPSLPDIILEMENNMQIIHQNQLSKNQSFFGSLRASIFVV